MKYLVTFLFLAFFSLSSSVGQEVTFAKDIAPIVFKHCTSCHRPGEIAPFALTTYDEVQARGPFIKYVTTSKYMPPWKPQAGLQHYQKENFLSDDQITLITKWVDQGMPRGNVDEEPELPVYPDGSQVGTPDMVVSFSQSYVHKGDGIDEYRYFVIPTNLAEDRYLTALEVRPGNKKIVHHTLVWADSTNASQEADAATPEYGFEGSAASTASNLNNQLPGYVPGQKPIVYKDGLAIRVPKGSDLLLQMHYAPAFSDEKDSTTVNLFFAKVPTTRAVQSYVMLPVPPILQNDIFIIPANQVKTFHGILPIPVKTTMLGLGPHCHLLGQNWHVFAIRPGNDTVQLIKINEWDFNWQGSYHFVKPVILPAGSTLHAIATYDNTVNNINNPNDPPKLISWGEKTSDEMYYLPLIYMAYKAGDENLIFEEEVLALDEPGQKEGGSKLYPIYPNPANNETNIYFTLEKTEKLSLSVYNDQGQLINNIYNNKLFASGQHIYKLETGSYQSGFYSVVLENGTNRLVQKFVIVQ